MVKLRFTKRIYYFLVFLVMGTHGRYLEQMNMCVLNRSYNI